LQARLAAIAAKLGTRDPNRVASQIALLINGALITSLITQSADLRGDLVDATMNCWLSFDHQQE